MIPIDRVIKFTKITAKEAQKINILVKLPERSAIADLNLGFTYNIDIIGEHLGQTFASRVEFTAFDLKSMTDDEFFRMLNEGIKRVFEFKKLAIDNTLKEEKA